jgi:hypothetical protein
MRKLLLVLLALGAVSAFGQNAFDGTWKLNTQNMDYQGKQTYLLQGGVWHCDTCDPKITIKADGKFHPVSGSPYTDSESVTVVNDHSVKEVDRAKGKENGTATRTVSDDGNTLTTEWTSVSEAGQESHGKYSSTRVGEAPAGVNKVSGTWHPDKVEDASAGATTFTYRVTGDEITMTDPTGDSYTAKCDGKDYPYKGDPGTTSVSLKKIDENTIEETDKRNGKVIGVSTMTIAPDGKTMKMVVDDKVHNATMNMTAERQ